MRWHVFTMDEYIGWYDNYGQAVEAAQAALDTLARPRRVEPGFYELKARPSVYDAKRKGRYIATGHGALRQGFDMPQLKEEE